LFFRVPFSFAFQSQLSVLLMMIVFQRKCCVCVVEILREPSNREPLREALGSTPVRLLPIALGLEAGARLLRHSSSDVLHQQLSPRISRPLVRSSHKRLATMQLDPIPSSWVVLLCSVVLAAVYGFSPSIPTPVPSSSCLVRRVRLPLACPLIAPLSLLAPSV